MFDKLLFLGGFFAFTLSKASVQIVNGNIRKRIVKYKYSTDLNVKKAFLKTSKLLVVPSVLVCFQLHNSLDGYECIFKK